MIDRQTDIQTACLVLPSLNSPKQPCQVFRDVWNILPVNFLLKLCELGTAIQSAQKNRDRNKIDQTEIVTNHGYHIEQALVTAPSPCLSEKMFPSP